MTDQTAPLRIGLSIGANVKREITSDDDRVVMSAKEERAIRAGLATLQLLCKLAPADGDAVGRAVQALEVVAAAIKNGVYREPEASDAE